MRKTALLTGAGSVENGWAPVLAALQLGEGQEHLANFIFSTLVYQQRFTARKLSEDDRQVATEDLSKVKRRIANQFIKARNLSVRSDFSKIYEDHIRDQTDWVIPITTNWDLELEKALHIYGYKGEVIHLHGSIQTPENLYLPTEAMDEVYWTSDQRNASQTEHTRTLRLLQECDELIIYGLSVSELDPELAILLGATIGGFEKVTVIDLVPKKVKDRLEFLLNASDSPCEKQPVIITIQSG